jgi:hypothetical protein
VRIREKKKKGKKSKFLTWERIELNITILRIRKTYGSAKSSHETVTILLFNDFLQNL